MTHIVGVDLSVGHSPDALILPNASKAFSAKRRRFYDLEVDASDLRRRIRCNDGPEERGCDKGQSKCDSHSSLLRIRQVWGVTASERGAL